VRPKSGEGWLKFDDERVEKATAAAAVADNWGGDGTAPAPPPPPPGGAPPPPPRLGAARFSSAYMLVYVRASEWDSVMCGVAEGDIPEHVRARLTAEAAARERQRRERAEAHLYALVRVATDADLKAQIGSARFFDLVDFSAVEAQLKVRRSATFAEVQRLVEERAGVPAAAQRFWRWAARQNATLRPSAPLLGPADDPAALAVERLIAGDAAAGRPRAGEMARLDLYLEAPPPAGAPPPPQPAAEPILLFLKYYDFAPPGGAPPALSYAGALVAPKAAKVSDLAPHMCRAAGLPEATTLEVFEEVKSEPTVMVEPLARGAALAAAALEDGDVLVFQRRPSAAEERGATFPRAHEFLVHVRNRVSVLFKPLDGPASVSAAPAPAPANGDAEMADAEGAAGKGAKAAAPPVAKALDELGEVRLELLKDMAYDAVSGALAAALGLGDPLRVRLTAQSPYSAMPRHAPLAYRPAATLEELVRGGAPLAGAAPPPPLAAPAVLFYEAIDLPLPEFERLVAHRITFHDAKHDEVAGVTVRVAKDLTVAQLLEEARGALPAAARRRVGAVAPLRLMEVYQWRVWQLFDPAVRLEDGLAATANLWHLRAEAVPEDQRGLAEPGALHAHVLQVCDREGAPGGREGFPCADPFVVALREGETAAELKARLREELGVPAREFAAWRLVLLSGFNFTMEPLPDDAVVVDRFTSRADLGPEKLYGHAERQFLGLHHENKNPRRTAAHIHRPPAVCGAGERALRIRA
jgi:ubiquitin carboxyl-terminal hydrolase 7